MKITRSAIATRKGSAEYFTGDVYIDVVAEADGRFTAGASNVHFTPGARTT
jgi:hypothetical protein